MECTKEKHKQMFIDTLIQITYMALGIFVFWYVFVR